MSDNSLQSLLERMKKGPATQKWDGVLALSRSRLNRMLEKQYVQRFDGYSFLPAFSGRVPLGTGSYQFVELNNIALGQPQIAFNSASLSDATAVVSMNIIAGHYTTSHQIPGALSTQLSELQITEQQGFKLEVDVNLNFVLGEVDRRGKVKFSLSDALAFRCNIGGNDDALNKQVADFFKQQFKTLPEHRGGFRLGEVELKGYNTLSPTTFRIVTQPAPGATVKGALNYGDGAVVLLLKLLGSSSVGQWPLNPGFEFFIPDNTAADGSDKYSAAFILSEAMLTYLQDNPQDPLNNLYFPGEFAFVEVERHTPRDLAAFGNISPLETSTSLAPAFKTLKAGDSVQFTLHDWKGQPIQASNWSARSLQSHTPEGSGTINGGLYTAALKAQIGHESLHVVVTAEYIKGGTTYKASALVLVSFDALNLAPQVATYAAQTQAQPIVLTASTADASPVTLSLLPPLYGALVQSGNQGLFTPDARAKAKSLVVQQVEAAGTEKRQSSLVLINARQELKIDPPYVAALKSAASVQLKDDTSLLPGVTRRWKVLSGSGTVDPNGLFTAAAPGVTSSNVVRCEIVRNGIVLSSGYSVVNHSDLDPEPGWETLAQFTLKVPGGANGETQGAMYGNGYNPLHTQILVETRPVDGNGYPLSPMERASMRLVLHSVKDEVEFVEDGLEGIPENDGELWRTRPIPNRFDLANPRAVGQNLPTRADPAITVQDLYLHTRARTNVSQTFHAMFQADRDKRWHRSTDVADANSMITVMSLGTEEYKKEDYSINWARVDGGSPSDPQAPEHDWWDFHLRTKDYWTISFIGRPGEFPGETFRTVEFLPVNGLQVNTTTIRWESEQVAERYFSWTGWIFRDPLKPVDSKINFDEATKDIVKGESLDVDVDESKYERGKLVISVHRSDRIPYVGTSDQSRVKLSQDLAVLLIDAKGNSHKLYISFLPVGTVGGRNKLDYVPF